MKIYVIIFIIFLLLVLGAYYYYYYNTVIEEFAGDNLKNIKGFQKIPKINFKFGLCPITDGYRKPKLIKNFIDKSLCDKIIKWGRPRMKDAEIIAYIKKNNKSRNNKTAWMPKTNPLSTNIRMKVQKLVKLPSKNFEDMQIAMYKPGMFFKHHTDQCKENEPPCRNENLRGGIRLYNLLIYLNDGFGGGETEFINLKLRFKPKPGDAILFENLNTKMKQCHPYSEHGGLEVTSGEKWICNFWVREDTFV